MLVDRRLARLPRAEIRFFSVVLERSSHSPSAFCRCLVVGNGLFVSYVRPRHHAPYVFHVLRGRDTSQRCHGSDGQSHGVWFWTQKILRQTSTTASCTDDETQTDREARGHQSVPTRRKTKKFTSCQHRLARNAKFGEKPSSGVCVSLLHEALLLSMRWSATFCFTGVWIRVTTVVRTAPRGPASSGCLCQSEGTISPPFRDEECAARDEGVKVVICDEVQRVESALMGHVSWLAAEFDRRLDDQSQRLEKSTGALATASLESLAAHLSTQLETRCNAFRTSLEINDISQ